MTIENWGIIILKNSSDYYKILGIRKNATIKEIKQAYRKLAMKYHPDRSNGVPKAEAEEYFKKINEVYSVLSDPNKRSRYDRWGVSGIDNPIPRNGRVYYTGYTRSHKSKRQIIEEKIAEGNNFDIQSFASKLDVKQRNLYQILEKMIEKGIVRGKIENGWMKIH